MNVAVDLDEVICEMTKPLRKALHEATSQDIPVSEWHDYYLGNIYGISKDEVFNIIREHQVLWNAAPFRGAVEAVGQLKERGFNVHIVTARHQFDPDGEKTTLWLKEHGIQYDQLHISCHKRGKAEIMKEISPVAMIDDHHENITECYPHTFMSILINRPWNSDVKFNESAVMMRADSLGEAIKLF